MTIHDGGTAIGSTFADNNGHWSFTPPVSLSDGEHDFTATARDARDAAGNESEPSDGFGFVLQVGSVPSVPAITGVFDGVEPQVGNIAPGGVTNDPRPESARPS